MQSLDPDFKIIDQKKLQYWSVLFYEAQQVVHFKKNTRRSAVALVSHATESCLFEACYSKIAGNNVNVHHFVNMYQTAIHLGSNSATSVSERGNKAILILDNCARRKQQSFCFSIAHDGTNYLYL